MYDITCSIVLYNNPWEEIKSAIESFIRTKCSVKLFLVDNSTTDKLRFHFNHPAIEYIFTGENIGFGAAHNIALARVKNISKYHLILNPDVEFQPQILVSIFNFMEKRQEIGLLMPKVLYRDGEIQYLCKKLPSPGDLFLRRFIPKGFKSMLKKQLDQYEPKDLNYDDIMDIPNLSGCFMFLRYETLQQTGFFDEQYFLYLEDTDLSRRVNEIARTVYYPRVSIIHNYKKESYKKLPMMMHHVQSAMKYFNKWGWFKDQYRQERNRTIGGIPPTTSTTLLKSKNLLPTHRAVSVPIQGQEVLN